MRKNAGFRRVALLVLSLGGFLLGPLGAGADPLRDALGMAAQDPEARVLGWSRDGKVAWVQAREREGIGGNSYQLILTNLVSDQELARWNLGDDGDIHNGKGLPTPSSTESHIRSVLGAQGVVIRPTKIAWFPAQERGQILSANLVKDTAGSKPFPGYTPGSILPETLEVTSLTLRLTRTDGTVKTHTLNLDGPYKPLSKPGQGSLGYYPSPFENRLAIPFAGEAIQGFGGSVIYQGQDVMMGSNLDLGFR